MIDHISECITISAGSLYCNDDRTEIPPYGYNIVQLNFTSGEGTVFIRQYDDANNCFLPDVSNTSSKTAGYWTFKLQKSLDKLATLGGCELLMVDDNPGFLEGRAEILRSQENLVVYTAVNFNQADEIRKNHSIDLALIDLGMDDNGNPEDRSGLRYKDQLVNAGIPVIMMTVHQDDARAAREALLPPYPANDYVIKSDKIEVFMNAIEKVLRSTP
jgi:CheY-like chemotaxis protein